MNKLLILLGVFLLSGIVTAGFWGENSSDFPEVSAKRTIFVSAGDVDSDQDGLTDAVDDDDDNDGILDNRKFYLVGRLVKICILSIAPLVILPICMSVSQQSLST